jgi:hypothetical protein
VRDNLFEITEFVEGELNALPSPVEHLAEYHWLFLRVGLAAMLCAA